MTLWYFVRNLFTVGGRCASLRFDYLPPIPGHAIDSEICRRVALPVYWWRYWKFCWGLAERGFVFRLKPLQKLKEQLRGQESSRRTAEDSGRHDPVRERDDGTGGVGQGE